MASAKLGAGVVDQLIGYQDTGEGFDRLWGEIAPTIESIAASRLRKHLVWERPGRVDRVAVLEVAQQVSAKLLPLRDPEAKGKFDPSRTAPGAAGVARWLFGIVSTEAANYCRDWRTGRGKVSCKTMTGLHLNSLEGAESARVPPKLAPVDLSAILNRCLDRIDPLLALPVRLRLQGLTDRDAGKKLGCSASTVNKRIAKATVKLRPLLESEGIDESFLDSLAA